VHTSSRQQQVSRSSEMASASRGFTLIELVATVTILSILAASAIPAVARIGDMQQSGVAARLADDLRSSRARSIATALPNFIRFGAPSDVLWSIVRLPTVATPFTSAVAVIDPTTGLAAVGPPTGIAVSASIQRGGHLGFDARGRPIASDGLVVTTDAVITVGTVAQVRISAGSGMVTTSRTP